MIDLVLVAFFQAASGAAAPPPEETEKPKMVCKYEFATGSRVKKVKVCRSTQQTFDEQDTKLQRELAKNGDHRVPVGSDIVSSGAGIGN